MATGIETIGLVLGALPIVIAALDHYNSTRKKWKDFTQKSLRIKQLIQGLNEQQVLLEMELELILRHVGAIHAADCPVSLSDLVQTIRLACRDQTLSAVLGKAFVPYMAALEACEKGIEKVVEAISGLIPDSTVRHRDVLNCRD